MFREVGCSERQEASRQLEVIFMAVKKRYLGTLYSIYGSGSASKVHFENCIIIQLEKKIQFSCSNITVHFYS
jgi:hypothetical protein